MSAEETENSKDYGEWTDDEWRQASRESAVRDDKCLCGAGDGDEHDLDWHEKGTANG